MNHIREDILMEFADGTLMPEQKKEAELHLLQCNECREELAMYKSLNDLLTASNIHRAPDEMPDEVMRRIEFHRSIMVRKAKSRNTLIRFGSIMFGMLAAIVSLGFIFGTPSGKDTGFQMPAFMMNAVSYMQSLKLTINNPVILYGVASFMIIMITERIYTGVKHRKVTASTIFGVKNP